VPALRRGAEAQTPRFFPPEPDGRFVVVPRVKVSQSNVTITFGASLVGKSVDLKDGRLDSVLPQPHTVSADPWNLTLPPGIYMLVIDGNDTDPPTLIVKPNQSKEQHVDG
jgi:hypothetical protein